MNIKNILYENLEKLLVIILNPNKDDEKERESHRSIFKSLNKLHEEAGIKDQFI